MYKIVGGDGREYGPVDPQQMRQWVQEGRVDANTMVRKEGGTEWKPLSQHPELASFLTAPSQAPSIHPSAPVPGVHRSREQKTSGLAIASLVLGLVGFACGVLTAIPGLVLGFVGLSKIRGSSGQLKGKGMAITGICISALTLVLSVVWIMYLVSTFKKAAGSLGELVKQSEQMETCLGERMASETANLLGGKGNVVVITSLAGGPDPLENSQLQAFHTVLQTSAEIKVLAVKSPSEDEVTSFIMGVPEAYLLRIGEEHPDAQVIVSFAGMPIPAKEGSKLGSASLPPVVAVQPLMMGRWKELIQNGVVAAAIMPRPDADWSSLTKAGTCAEMFAARYVVVTRENVAQIAQKLTPGQKQGQEAQEAMEQLQELLQD